MEVGTVYNISLHFVREKCEENIVEGTRGRRRDAFIYKITSESRRWAGRGREEKANERDGGYHRVVVVRMRGGTSGSRWVHSAMCSWSGAV